MKNSPGDQISNFRVRIYQIDPLTGGPGADLLTSPIIRTVTKKDEVITVDLQPYQILVDLSSFFVALEWLKTDANMMMMTVKGQKKHLLIYLRLELDTLMKILTSHGI